MCVFYIQFVVRFRFVLGPFFKSYCDQQVKNEVAVKIDVSWLELVNTDYSGSLSLPYGYTFHTVFIVIEEKV